MVSPAGCTSPLPVLRPCHRLERLRQERQQAALQKRAAGLQTPRADSPAAPASPAAAASATAAAIGSTPAAGTVMVAGAKKGITSAAQLKTKLEEAVRQSRTLSKGGREVVGAWGWDVGGRVFGIGGENRCYSRHIVKRWQTFFRLALMDPVSYMLTGKHGV